MVNLSDIIWIDWFSFLFWLLSCLWFDAFDVWWVLMSVWEGIFKWVLSFSWHSFFVIIIHFWRIMMDFGGDICILKVCIFNCYFLGMFMIGCDLWVGSPLWNHLSVVEIVCVVWLFLAGVPLNVTAYLYDWGVVYSFGWADHWPHSATDS